MFMPSSIRRSAPVASDLAFFPSLLPSLCNIRPSIWARVSLTFMVRRSKLVRLAHLILAPDFVIKAAQKAIGDHINQVLAASSYSQNAFI